MGSNTETTMVEYDKIWDFVEEKFKTPVPPYFKNILKVCGYNNGVTIASIVEDDFQYFVDEVRNGSVAKYFEGKIEVKKIFEGSPKTAEDFEFTRGHKKFLISIALFLKKYLDENGPDSISKWSETEVASNKKSVNIQKKKPVQRIPKKIKFTSVDFLKKSSTVTNAAHQDNPNGASQPLLHDLKTQKIKLQIKVVASLRTHTSELYLKNIEMINQKIACDLIEVDVISQSKDQQKLLDIPVDKSVDLPVEKSVDFPVDKSVEVLVDKSVEVPVDKSVEIPVDKSVELTVDKSIDLTVKDSTKYTAKVSCPFCPQKIRVFHVPNENGVLRWNSSNFDRHLKKCHKTEIPVEEPAKTDETAETGIEMIKIDEMMTKSVEKLATTSKVNETFETGIETIIIDEMTAKSDKKLATTSKADETSGTGIEMIIIDEVTAKSDEKLATTSKADETSGTGIETIKIDQMTKKTVKKLATTSKVDETSQTGIELIKIDEMTAKSFEKLATISKAETDMKAYIDEMSKQSIDVPASIVSRTAVTDCQTIKIDEVMKKYVQKPATITSIPVFHNKIVSYSDSDSDSNEEEKENDYSKAISRENSGHITIPQQSPKRKKVPKEAPKPATKRNKFDNLSSIGKYTKFKKNWTSRSNQSVDQKEHLEKSWKKY